MVRKTKLNSLEVDYPMLVEEWHPTKNGDLKPSDVTAGNGSKKIWWLCKKGGECGCIHEWSAPAYNRAKLGSGCSYCSGLRVCIHTSLRYKRPDIADQWHPTKNGDLTPETTAVTSDIDVWWYCPKSECGCVHEWVASPHSRAGQGCGCRWCVGRVVCQHSCLSSRRPDIAAQWHPTKNGELTPEMVTAGSSKKVWWYCDKAECGCIHEWIAPVAERAKRGCRWCAGQAACQHTCLSSLRPDIAAQWHPTKNGELTPEMVTVGSSKRVWWYCDKAECGCIHEWQAPPSGRTKSLRDSGGCRWCAGQAVCKHTSLSGRRPDIANQWHPTKNGELTPDTVTVRCGIKVWWLCDVGGECGCNHEWESIISHRTGGSGCPYCAGSRTCPHTCLLGLHPTIAAEWHPTKNGTLTPLDVAAGSSKKVWWQCSVDGSHEWATIIHHRTAARSLSGCPRCVTVGYSKVAIRWLAEVASIENIVIQTALSPGGEYHVRRARGRSYKADGYHKPSNTIFEFHGTIWHGDIRYHDPDSINPVTNVPYGILYERTMTKEAELRALGYRLVVMWEADYVPGTLMPMGLATALPLRLTQHIIEDVAHTDK